MQIVEHWLKHGKLDFAKPLLAEIVKNYPNHSPAIELQATVLAHEGKAFEAIRLLTNFTHSVACPASAKIMLGDLYLAEGRPADAISFYKSAIDYEKPIFEVLHNLVLAHAQLFLFGKAVQFFEKAGLLNRNSFELQVNWGASLKNLGRYRESLEHLLEAERMAPLDPRILLNLGVTLEALDRQSEALDCYERAIKIDPHFLEAHCNKANSLLVLRKHDDAYAAFQKALLLNPKDPDTLHNLSFLQLSKGDYKNGWRNYEQRWYRQNASKKLFSDIPPLLNLENIKNRKILAWSEQGLGDSLQFCRYLSVLGAMGANITLATHAPLIEVFKTLKGVEHLITIENQTPVDCEAQVSLLSLPYLFQEAGLQNPSEIPYLQSNPAKNLVWKRRLQSENKLKVGLVWNGGFRANQPEIWAVNARRNIPLVIIAKLKTIPNVQFFSLQKGEPAESELLSKRLALWPEANLSIYTQELNTFEDTAALIDNLDLVISVDTSTAHLAGALGKPLWILNRYDSCWRWLINQESTHWYPNARIFNQPAIGDWESVINKVEEELIYLVKTIQLN
jgi:tetratricopeptide (TPR) repeat protein